MELYNAPEVYERIVHYDTEKEVQVRLTINNFRGSYCDNIPFGYGLSVTPIQLINAYGKIITGRNNFQATFEKQKKKNKNQYNQGKR